MNKSPKRILPVKCDPENRLRRMPLEQIKKFQGNLKELRAEQYDKLRASMESKGFFAPVFVWNDRLVDGHQRLNVLEREGWDVEGGIPVVEIEATDEKDAAEKLLLLSSTYGKVEPQGLYEFTSEHEIDLREFDLPDLPDFDMEAFDAGFYEGDQPAADRPSIQRDLGNKDKQIRPVLYLDEIEIFERAIALTGERNRGQAIVKVCQAFIDASTTER